MLVYVVEDDEQQRDFFTKTLQTQQHQVIAFRDTISAQNYFYEHNKPDAILLDYKFDNGPDGMLLAGQVHAMCPSAAVVMTSAYADKAEIVQALRIGVDDFLLKPIDMNELLQRVGNAVLKRRTTHPVDVTIRKLGELRFDPATRVATWHGRNIALTRSEAILLTQITAHPGQVYNYSELYALCTGEHVAPSEASKGLRTHVHNLKHKFSDAVTDAPCPIVSIRGDGIVWNARGEESEVK